MLIGWRLDTVQAKHRQYICVTMRLLRSRPCQLSTGKCNGVCLCQVLSYYPGNQGAHLVSAIKPEMDESEKNLLSPPSWLRSPLIDIIPDSPTCVLPMSALG